MPEMHGLDELRGHGEGQRMRASIRAGDSGYAEIAVLECRRYIALLRLAIGREPDGARLRIRRADTGYEDQNPAVRGESAHTRSEGGSPMPVRPTRTV
jgi:hypothetical protein